jgi:hypothetical protein
MTARDVYVDGVFREHWDDDIFKVTFYGEGGVTLYQRDYTPIEIAEANTIVQNTNRSLIFQQALDAIAANKAFIALTAPTNAQVLAQMKALSRQVDGLMRLALNKFDGTD